MAARELLPENSIQFYRKVKNCQFTANIIYFFPSVMPPFLNSSASFPLPSVPKDYSHKMPASGNFPSAPAIICCYSYEFSGMKKGFAIGNYFWHHSEAFYPWRQHCSERMLAQRFQEVWRASACSMTQLQNKQKIIY